MCVKKIAKWLFFTFDFVFVVVLFILIENIFARIFLIIYALLKLCFLYKSDVFKRKIEQSENSESLANEERIMLEKVKYLALQNQINPHFLYNTLEGIRSEALLGNAASAAKISELLASYFRYTITNLDKMVTVEDELSNIMNYFRIQKFRFDDRIAMNIEFEKDEQCNEKLKLCKIPKVTLQPIVENAILHGLEPKLKNGNVTIRFEVYETRLEIVVSDTGVGMSQEKVDYLNDVLFNSSKFLLRDEAESIGIVNVNRRLKLTFGADFGLRFFSKENEGTDVEISIPFHHSGKHL